MLESKIGSFESRAEQVARSFLQSVLVIDDQAELVTRLPSELGVDKGTENPEPSRGRNRPTNIIAPSPVGSDNVEASHVLDAKSLTDAFAEIGLVCGLLKPAAGENIEVRTIRAASRSDILIFDWSFRRENGVGDDGELALRLIRAILFDINEQHRVRFIAIYTAEPHLRGIAERCKLLLDQLQDDLPTIVHGEFLYSRGPVRISIFGKARQILGDEELARRMVAAEDLPNVIVTEFARTNMGLVANVALRAVSEIRRNTHRLLARFDASVDAGFLWHRFVLEYPVDADRHLASIVLGEIELLVDDEAVRSEVDDSALLQWLQYKKKVLTSASHFSSSNVVTENDLEDLVRFGFEAVKAKFPSLNGRKVNLANDSLANFADSPEDHRRSQEAFSGLMTLKKSYDRELPRLQAGTIVENANNKFFVCVQPMCDSIRLYETSRGFPMLPMLERANDSASFDLVLPTDAEKCARFRISLNPYDLVLTHFVAGSCDYAITAKRGENNELIFVASDGAFRFRGQLKREKAQSIIAKLGLQFSRPPFTEPEWLRRWSDR